jgi:hypothetical protein
LISNNQGFFYGCKSVYIQVITPLGTPYAFIMERN